MTQKLYKGMPFHNRAMRATIYPWMHHIHTWVGFAIVYEDHEKQDELMYFVPEDGGPTFTCRVHRTTIYVSKDGKGVKLGDDVNPETDEQVTGFSLP